MTSRRRSTRPLRIDRARFRALHAFCRGYLHEDLPATDGTSGAAAAAFAADASAAERDELTADWTRFIGDMADRPLADVRRAFEMLGAAWLPGSLDDLAELDRAIRSMRRDREA